MNITRVRIASVLGCTVAVSLSCAAHAAAQNAPRVGIVLEAAGVWSTRNDVRIPPEGGTEFSIVDLIGSGPAGAARLETTIELSERHGLRLTYAPLRISGTGVPATSIVFAGGLFSSVPTEAKYQFDSYRATYRYRFYKGETWSWRVGFTGFVRDARIALEQPGTSAEDTDVGFVPLGHLSGEARLAERWGLLLELDGSAAPQGRAFDALAAVEYRPAPRWTIAAGYRTIEGGADVDEVYTFAWLNAAVVRVRLSIGPRGR
jgi:hypothetical protein